MSNPTPASVSKLSITPTEGESTPRDLPADAVPGSGTYVHTYVYNNFNQPVDGGLVTGIIERHTQSVFQASAPGSLPQWGKPYSNGTVHLSFDDIIALPSAEAFFGELWTKAAERFALQDNPPPPPEPLP